MGGLGWPQAAPGPRAEVTPLPPCRKGKREAAARVRICVSLAPALRAGDRAGVSGGAAPKPGGLHGPGMLLPATGPCGDCTERNRCACTRMHTQVHACPRVPTLLPALPCHLTNIYLLFLQRREVRPSEGPRGSRCWDTQAVRHPLRRDSYGGGEGGCFSVDLHG